MVLTSSLLELGNAIRPIWPTWGWRTDKQWSSSSLPIMLITQCTQWSKKNLHQAWSTSGVRNHDRHAFPQSSQKASTTPLRRSTRQTLWKAAILYHGSQAVHACLMASRVCWWRRGGAGVGLLNRSIVAVEIGEFLDDVQAIRSCSGYSAIQVTRGVWTMLQIHINFLQFLPILPDFLEWISHLAPIY